MKGGSFGDKLFGKLRDAGLIKDRLIHSYNASAPTQAAFVERMNSMFDKARLAVQAEQGTFSAHELRHNDRKLAGNHCSLAR